ncbi:MAG: PQQ-binding-like beta-propeller repeat protein [Myxococcaceae bacterium]
MRMFEFFKNCVSCFISLCVIFAVAPLGFAQTKGTPGTLQWQCEISGTAGDGPTKAAVMNGVVYVRGDSGLAAVNTQTGLPIWGYQTGRMIGGETPATANGVVYMPILSSSSDPLVLAFNGYTGQLIWNVTTDGLSPTPAVEDGVVYIWRIAVLALNAATGQQIWNYNQTADLATVADGVVYCVSQGFINHIADQVYALNAATGTLIWSFKWPIDKSFFDNSAIQPPAFANGVLYVGAVNSTIYAFDAAIGKQIWNSTMYSLSMSLATTPTVVSGVLYFASDRVYALNAATGQQIWNFTSGKLYPSSVAVLDGVLYCGIQNTLFAIYTSTGQKIWDFNPTNLGFSVSPPTVADGIVYFSYGSSLYALNAGALLPPVTSQAATVQPSTTQPTTAQPSNAPAGTPVPFLQSSTAITVGFFAGVGSMLGVSALVAKSVWTHFHPRRSGDEALTLLR